LAGGQRRSWRRSLRYSVRSLMPSVRASSRRVPAWPAIAVAKARLTCAQV